MSRFNPNNKGFGAVEGVLVLVIVLLLAILGWVIYKDNHKTTVSSTAPATTVPSTVSSTSATSGQTKYFTITQWRVRAPYSGNLTLEYLPPTGNEIYLSSTQLDASNPSCGLNQTGGGYGGFIERMSSTQQMTNSVGQNTGQTAAQFYSSNVNSPGIYVAHVGSYYYMYTPSNGFCSQNSVSLQKQTMSAFENITKSLQAVPFQ